MCTAAGVFQHVSAEKEITTAEILQSAVSQTVNSETEKTENSTSSADEQSGNSGRTDAGGGQSSGSKKQQTTSKANQPNVQTTAERQTTTAARHEEPAKTEKSTVTVTFSISCKNALNYGADVPSSGYFLSPVSYTAEEGETVFDALKTLCRDNGISLNYQDIYYIQGIGGLNEKDCGGQSGWMYRVNGTAPNKAACKYTLSDGDRVEWYYVTSPSDR